ncbi:adenylate kinase family protein [[Mycoplasma] testudinis]|uniref:adenylate kinase family protein n=1 Tax=[Mycoplasma] testudinis TaxID=33924 RepID=UPI0004804826|nr:nucleoside monophosphate kinase [[Mycoplasma] testudinis]
MITKITKKRIIFLGAPGTGKGTISQLLKQRLNFVHLSTGDIFRNIVSTKTALAEKVSSFLLEGKYVPDDTTNEVVKETLSTNLGQLSKSGFILDGYPRTLDQAQYLNTLTPIDCALLLEPSDLNFIVKRLSGRRVCPSCQTIYNVNVSQMQPKVANQCDKDNTILMARKDDGALIVEGRIRHYLDTIQPVIDFYLNQGLLVKIDANLELEDLYSAVVDTLK